MVFRIIGLYIDYFAYVSAHLKTSRRPYSDDIPCLWYAVLDIGMRVFGFGNGWWFLIDPMFARIYRPLGVAGRLEGRR